MNKFNKQLQQQASWRKKQIAMLRKENKTWQQIADAFGITRQRAQQLGKIK